MSRRGSICSMSMTLQATAEERETGVAGVTGVQESQNGLILGAQFYHLHSI
jgi:hypothetical protein